jgi:hypothetical protein
MGDAGSNFTLNASEQHRPIIGRRRRIRITVNSL